MEIKNGTLTQKLESGIYSVPLDKINGFDMSSEDDLVPYKSSDPAELAIIQSLVKKEKRKLILAAIIGSCFIIGLPLWILVIIGAFRKNENIYNAQSHRDLWDKGWLKQQRTHYLVLDTDGGKKTIFSSYNRQRMVKLGEAIIEAARSEDNKSIHITYENKTLVDHNNLTN